MISVFAYSHQGMETAGRVIASLPDHICRLYTPEKYLQPGAEIIERPTREFYGDCFRNCDALIFIGAAGIAVRSIAPHVKDKRTDPAVLCLDELGTYVIPLLSGHIGGANQLAQQLAQVLGATAVITTATDIHQKFSVDAWAARQGFLIDNMKMAKAVSAAILEQKIPVFSEFPVEGEYPGGTYLYRGDDLNLNHPKSTAEFDGEQCTDGDVCIDIGRFREKDAKVKSNTPPGIYIGCSLETPFAESLRLIPKVLHLGIGCRRDTPAERIEEAVQMVFAEHRLDLRAVKGVYSIDLKAQESGLLQVCDVHQWPFIVYSAEELMQVSGEFQASSFVKSVTGVDNVCERAALKDAVKILVHKAARDGVTVAVAEEELVIRFA